MSFCGPRYSRPESLYEDSMIIHVPNSVKVEVSKHICDYHVKNPNKQYAGCTCSSAYKMIGSKK